MPKKQKIDYSIHTDRKSIVRKMCIPIYVITPFVLFYSLASASSEYPLSLVIGSSSIGFILCFIISSKCALKSSRKITWMDILRIYAWSLFGWGLAPIILPLGPYAYWMPAQQVSSIKLINVSIFTMAIIVIIVSRIVCISPPTIMDHECCNNCGYRLKGIDKRICPECGQECEFGEHHEES